MYGKQAQPTHSLADAQKFIAELNEEAKHHRAIHHPYLQKLICGDLPDPKASLKDFFFQYLAYSVDFMRYLMATMSQLDDRKYREKLMGNLMEESGRVDPEDASKLAEIGVQLEWVQGVPHPDLFKRFLRAIDINESYLDKNDFCDDAKIWRKMFLNVCTSGGGAQALGAMGIGTENIVKYVYLQILEAIKVHLKVSPKDRVFFDLHALLDDEHGEILDNIAVEYARYERNRPDLRNGMLMALNLRASFFDAMMSRAENLEWRKTG